MSGTSLATKEKIHISLPKKYKVIIKDESDGTPINGKQAFVQQLLVSVFNLQANKALGIIKKLDKEKIAIIGVFSKQIAETYVNKANEYLKQPVHSRYCFVVKLEQE